MANGLRTPLFDWHVARGARMVEFGGWEMPLLYPTGIVAEHLATRKQAGLFDVSHMGRFRVRGKGALACLQQVLSSNAAALDVGRAHYTLLPTETGGAVDDAYLYRFVADEYLLVVNAANRQQDWEHLQPWAVQHATELVEETEEVAMLALQGPRARAILEEVITAGALPEPVRNALGRVRIGEAEVGLSRTGYTGEPLSFELFLPRARAVEVWELLIAHGAAPIGLGARDTLRLEAGLPLYGHELGEDAEGREIPIYAVPSARPAVSFSELKGNAIGRGALRRQVASYCSREREVCPDPVNLPRLLRSLAVLAQGVARAGAKVFRGEEHVGFVTSGTMAPYWVFEGEGIEAKPSERHGLRPIALALVQAHVKEGERLRVEVRGQLADAVVVPYHLRSEAPPYARPIVYADWRNAETVVPGPADHPRGGKHVAGCARTARARTSPTEAVFGTAAALSSAFDPRMERAGQCGDRTQSAPSQSRNALPEQQTPAEEAAMNQYTRRTRQLLNDALANHNWRQHECINLIPSEMTTSPLVRLLSVMDPAFRYAEHKKLKAFAEEEVFYYQGVDFIARVEKRLVEELGKYLGCPQVETRLLSGQMANLTVYSALVDHFNRLDRKAEPRRLGCVMNHHITRGGHLSAQPMGALHDYVARDPRTERPAVVNFPVLADNPYRIDVARMHELLDIARPQLIIFGKSLVLHKEPVAEIRQMVEAEGWDLVLMYDMAHVLGLVGPHFQQPFAEGADLVTGSTHKTFFGTQRGVIGAQGDNEELWEAIERRSFPGAVSNHHLGTMLGLLMATYEMNAFKDQYQPQVIANAKAFARALKDCGLTVEGDSSIDFTETHQVLLRVGHGRGAELARRLEENNIICNYQALPDEESFTVAGGLRLGVAEMTRFGLKEADFGALASLMADVILHGAAVKEEVRALRGRFRDLHFCFTGDALEDAREKLRGTL